MTARPRPASSLWRLWWVVAIVTLMGIGLSVFATMSVPTTYTARASLIVSSNNRSPDQDAVLVQGYVEYFNDTAFQTQLVDQTDIGVPVSLSARAAASSPILIIEATASDPDYATSAAAEVAEAFRTNINAVGDQTREDQIAELQSQIDDARRTGDTAAIPALQSQITTIQDDRTNVLQELQFEGGGVATNAPSLVRNVAVGGAGGLVLGVLTALGLHQLLGRPRTRRRA